jgi:hypothetical protein
MQRNSINFLISPRIFIEIRNDPHDIFRDRGRGGGTDSWKKSEGENIVSDSL